MSVATRHAINEYLWTVDDWLFEVRDCQRALVEERAKEDPNLTLIMAMSARCEIAGERWRRMYVRFGEAASVRS